MARSLVSGEREDLIGVSITGRLDRIEVLPYDPGQVQLDGLQCTTYILISPYRHAERPNPLLAKLPELGPVQVATAGFEEWSGQLPVDVSLTVAPINGITTAMPAVAGHRDWHAVCGPTECRGQLPVHDPAAAEGAIAGASTCEMGP
ncbi:hypothetical protein CRH09_15280 [Nocardia terpenica]|uniref:Uncharacterized protein n=1 Tax=Nocardia terpenica TaxID=455432 RepID=A0A291RJ55_9NOCA|nr:hypothetical protein CRH09_15280 [Nocardia terpenica]